MGKHLTPKNTKTSSSTLAIHGRKAGALAAQTFIDIVFSMPWFNIPSKPCVIQFDGVLASYLAHYHVYLYQKYVEYIPDDILPIYLANFFDIFQVLTMEVFTPTNEGTWGEVLNQQVNKLIDTPLTEVQARQRYRESIHGVYACAEKLWSSHIEELNNEHDKVAICEGSNLAFRVAYIEALENFAGMFPIDISASEHAKEVLEESASILQDKNIVVSIDTWVNAYRRGYLKLWHHLATGQVTLKTIRDNLQNNIIGFQQSQCKEIAF